MKHPLLRMKHPLLIAALALPLAAWDLSPADAVGADGDEPRVWQVQMIDKGSAQWRFEPAEITARPGDTVRFVMADIVPHNVEFKSMPEGVDLGALKMGPFLLQKGATYDVPIDDRFAPGQYEFVCTPHLMFGMKGTIDVIAGQ